MGARRPGQGGTCPLPWKCCKVFFCIYSKTFGRPIIYALFSEFFVGFWGGGLSQTPIRAPPQLASLAPTYLTTDIHLVSEYGRRPLRSSTDRTLTVPRTHNRFGDRSFAVAGPRLWNSLPISLRKISSYGQFRRYLKNHLFGI